MVCFDTNALIEVFEGEGDRAKRLDDIFGAAREAGSPIVVSELAFAEAMVKPIETNNVELTLIYIQLFKSREYLRVCPIDRLVLYYGALIRAGHKGIKLPDAIHLASAARMRADMIITGDKRLSNLDWTLVQSAVDASLPAPRIVDAEIVTLTEIFRR